MDTREMASEYRLASWAQAMQERVANKETIKDFCERRGVSRHSYFYWQRRLREAAAKQIEQEVAKPPRALVPSGWAQVSTAQETPNVDNTRESTLSIEIGRCRMLVSESTDSALLEKVFRVLASLC